MPNASRPNFPFLRKLSASYIEIHPSLDNDKNDNAISKANHFIPLSGLRFSEGVKVVHNGLGLGFFSIVMLYHLRLNKSLCYSCCRNNSLLSFFYDLWRKPLFILYPPQNNFIYKFPFRHRNYIAFCFITKRKIESDFSLYWKVEISPFPLLYSLPSILPRQFSRKAFDPCA